MQLQFVIIGLKKARTRPSPFFGAESRGEHLVGLLHPLRVGPALAECAPPAGRLTKPRAFARCNCDTRKLDQVLERLLSGRQLQQRPPS